MMSRNFLTAALICVGCSVNAQSTLIVITDLYQDALSYNPDLTERVVQDVKELITAHNGSVFSFYCDDSGNHHASGQQNVVAHLDSIQNSLIAPPIARTSWNIEGLDLVRDLIQQEVGFDILTLCLFTIGDRDPNYQSEFLFPFAHVINRVDATGEIDPRLTVQVHSNFSLETNPTLTTITTLR